MNDNGSERTESRKALRTLAFGMLLGVGAVVVFGVQGKSVSEFFTISSVGIMAAGASLLVGGALGFLFGIPKTLQQESPTGSPEENQALDQRQGTAPLVRYRVNTNLEQISDWLTKMLVGVGLTQLYILPGKLQQLTKYIGGGLGDSSYNEVFALALLLYFIVVGFLFGYLWTRLFLAGALREADMSVIGALTRKIEKATIQFEQTDKEFEQFKKQPERDAEALSLTFKQLHPGRDEPEIAQDALNSAIASASNSMKVQIFNEAVELRSETWREDSTKREMERTIPIFRALISCDPEEKFHKNHGQLGYALKDKIEGDWAEAERELTKAIEIRGPWKKYGWLFYEFNRAFCRIKQDSAFKQNKTSDSKIKKLILDDLGMASNADFLQNLIASDSVIQQWMKLNGQ